MHGDDARELVLGRIRSANRIAGVDAAAAPQVDRRYRVDGTRDTMTLVALLEERLADYRAEVVRSEPGDVAAHVRALTAGLPSVVAPEGLPESWLAGVPGVLRDCPGAPLEPSVLDSAGAVVTGSRIAIAETGTIVLDGSADQGRRVLTLVPDVHVCIVTSVVASVPEALAAVRPTAPLTLISGPSATSDIELSRVEGVHGPRTLRVVIVVPAESTAPDTR